MADKLLDQHFEAKACFERVITMFWLAAVLFVAVGASIQLATLHSLTVLHSFTGSPDGSYPLASLLIDAKGSLYGTTFEGGTDGFGTVFKVSKGGNETLSFSVDTGDGAFPNQPVIQDASGNLYGVALEGTGGSGVAFKLNPAGKKPFCTTFREDCSTKIPRTRL